ncbi:MAG: class I SAM-dependent methyltransferase [Gammaproteobacteria bacterium]|nr:class I SAM-dependent methyltransferase [Gammaproteobacteria bacterium]MCP4089270.1 class I SAM-dependent methyltransferase [Gammaproteobacteria bacterium]MCP4275306.1 class I SAM-dependent methyltransferase [Gammaproteobacteria bacterium]MCP4830910.1 class I SAM-dependent methyltransferase [Gammaproteobacteria bacterium]
MLTNNQNSDVLNRTFMPHIFQSEKLEEFFVAVIDRLHQGKLTVNFPSGNARNLSGSEDTIEGQKFHASWNLKSYKAIRRILRCQSMGFAESYMEGEWDSNDLTHLLELMAYNMDAIESSMKDWGLVRIWNQIQHSLRSNTRRGSRKNIAYHYDLGNDFYQLWLDPSMTYSSGVFDEEHHDLDSAQENKYRKLAEELELKSHHRVLEIGCGWGGFAEFAARRYGCTIVCLTLSQEQLHWAKKRISQAGLSDLVEIRFQDYRDVQGKFDRIVSVEMFEAVGEEHWSGYFDQVHACLKPGGRAGLQIISIANERYDSYRNKADFIQKYIFPGGMLPSDEKLDVHIEESGLTKTGQSNFGLSYARTLELWRKEFLKNWNTIARLGYSEKFKRMWEYYLCYCEAGFKRGTIDVGHYFLQKDAAIHTYQE